MLFSEPKIPQCARTAAAGASGSGFQCSSASRKFLNGGDYEPLHRGVQVSVLFSEPKIPQSGRDSGISRRAARFQCSSASRKFLNLPPSSNPASTTRFSALQRAENSSISVAQLRRGLRMLFQCSSASRKFLNGCRRGLARRRASFQCSSASRKFLNHGWMSYVHSYIPVSVLFSEPKIPQCTRPAPGSAPVRAFQCSSASRKFLNAVEIQKCDRLCDRFSALQRAENSSISASVVDEFLEHIRFSALQRAENSSIGLFAPLPGALQGFQCSSASRKFLNSILNAGEDRNLLEFQCSSASRKFLNSSL